MYKDDTEYRDFASSEFRKNLDRNNIMSSDGTIRGKGKNSIYTALELEVMLDKARGEMEKSIQSSKREKKVGNIMTEACQVFS